MLGDLKGILQSASFLERKTFLGSFIRRIDFTRQEVGIEYTAPIPVGSGSTKTTEVLRVRGVGSPVWPPGRTFAWVWFKLPQTVSRRTPTRGHKSPCDACPGFAPSRPRREIIDSDPRRPHRGEGVRHSYLAVLAAPSGGRADQQDQGNAESENLNGMPAKLRCLGHKLPARIRVRHDRVNPSGEAPGPIAAGRTASFPLLPATPDRRTLRGQLQ